jgi:hypothetical protein
MRHDGFVSTVRELGVTPHVMQNTSNRRSAIDGRTTHHRGYEISLSKRWLVEKPYGWLKQIGPLIKVKLRGLANVEWLFVFSCAGVQPFAYTKTAGASGDTQNRAMRPPGNRATDGEPRKRAHNRALQPPRR